MKNIATYIFYALLTSKMAFAETAEKYVTIKNENEKWVVVGITENIPTYQEGFEILSLPSLNPVFDTSYQLIESPYGGFDCPITKDKEKYTPCTSDFYRFAGANWFGLGGIRVKLNENKLIKARQELIRTDIQIAKIWQEQKEKEEKRIKEQQLATEKNEREEREEAEKRRQIYEATKASNLKKMARAEKGTEDTCKRKWRVTGSGWLIGPIDPDNVDIACTFSGDVQLQDLPNAGWIIVNKNKNQDGYVSDYLIRKVR